VSFTLLFRSGFEGHHIYEDDEDGRLVIADHSADDDVGWPKGPEHTDDGPLFVDFDRPVAKARFLSSVPTYVIPARKPNGEAVSFCGRLDEVHRLERYAKRRFG
jgi:hypothetical protein